MRAAVGHLQLGITVAADRLHDRPGSFVDEILHLVALLGSKTLDVIVLLLTVVVSHRIDALRIVLRHPDRIFGEMEPQVVQRRIVLPPGIHHDQPVVADEFAKQLAASVGIEPADFVVVPDILPGQGRSAPLLEYDLVDRIA